MTDLRTLETELIAAIAAANDEAAFGRIMRRQEKRLLRELPRE